MATQLLEPKFEVGEPANELAAYTFPHGYPARCKCDGDYSGADPRLQFPAGFHVVAGDGLDEPERRTFRYHQDCARWEPERLKVANHLKDVDFPTHPVNPDDNLLRMLNGNLPPFNTPFSARCARRFDKFPWQPGTELVISQWFWFDFTLPVRFYANLEGRGLLEFNEDSDPDDVMQNNGIVREVLSFELTKTAFRVRWWHAPYRDEKNHWRGKQLATVPFAFHSFEWYKVRLRFVPLPEQWYWQTEVMVRNHAKTQRKKFTTPSPIDTGKYVDTVYFGDERGRDDAGGKFFCTAPSVWARAAGEMEGEEE